MNDYSCTLPLPPSANDLVRPAILGYRNGKPVVRLVKTTEAKAWLKSAQAQLTAAPLSGPVELFAEFFMPSISSDVSNRVKQLEDALTGFAWHDDKQVAEVHVIKRIAGGEGPHVIVRVVPALESEHEVLSYRLNLSAQRAAKAEKPAAKLRRLATSATRSYSCLNDPSECGCGICEGQRS